LTATPEKPYALHGVGGVIHQSLGGTSAYYSAPLMRAHGSFSAGGHRVTFTGTAWLDHQWGSFQNDPRAFNWDWFSCRFDDRTELMLYRFRDRTTGKPLAAYASGTFDGVDGQTLHISAFTAAHDGRVLHEAGRDWPLDWHVTVPAVHLDLRLRSLARHQLFLGILVPTFWEGAATVTGTKTGHCFVEETYR
jgi:predicted secreted hydrolase